MRPPQRAGDSACVTPVLVVTSDVELRALIERCAAAASCAVVVGDDDSLARDWPTAPMVIIGVDALGGASASMAKRPGVVVATMASGEPDASTWRDALQIGAEHVIALPEAQGWLVDRLGAIADVGSTNGMVIAVIGSAGGVGASTLALALGAAAADKGKTLVIDADPWGGGLECIAGCDDQPGARWSNLDQSVGRIAAGALHDAFPQANGASLLSFPKRVLTSLTPASLTSVIDGACRSFDFTIIDLPRAFALDTRPDAWVLMTTDRVRPVLTACAVLDVLIDVPVHIVLRRVPGGSVDPKDVGRVLGRKIAAEMSNDRVVAEAGDHGDPMPSRGSVRSTAGALWSLLTLAPPR